MSSIPSMWESRFNNHALWTDLKTLKASLTNVKLASETDAAAARARVSWLLEVLQAHREAEDVRPYTPSMLDNVQRQLANVSAHLSQYVGDPTTYATSLVTAGTNVDTVLDQMGNWPSLAPKGAAQAAGKVYAEYASATAEALNVLASDRAELAAELQAVREEVATERQAIATALGRLESSAASDLEAAVERISAEQLERGAESVERARVAGEGASRDAAAIADLRTQGNKIVAAAAVKVVADDYRKDARNKALAGWVWDLLGVTSVGVPLAILLVHFLGNSTDKGLTTPLALTRIGISIAGLGLATLCFNRGSSNHHEARISKGVDLRINTVRGFVANQDEDFQQELLDGMAERIYLRGILDEARPDEADTTGLLAKAREARVARHARNEGESPPAS